MGTIKIEFDCPDFEKEISINIVVKKDGDAVISTTAKSGTNNPISNLELTKKEEEKPIQEIEEPKTPKKERKTSTKKMSGNLMNLEI